MKFKLDNNEIKELCSGKTFEYPKYSTQIMNLANQNAQGTRPRIVGQMSNLIQEFQGQTLPEWEKWYLDGHPSAVDDATKKVFEMVKSLRDAANTITEEIVRQWIEELVVVKTFVGLRFQEAILKKIAQQLNTTYRLAKPNEESQGIDGYLGEKAVSIKPTTYDAKQGLNETIGVPIIFYEKKKTSICIIIPNEVM
jgi:hypothetical protein